MSHGLQNKKCSNICAAYCRVKSEHFVKTLFVIFCAVVLLTFRGCRNTHLWWMVRNLRRLEQHAGFFATNPFFLWQIHSSQDGKVDFLFRSSDNFFDTFLKKYEGYAWSGVHFGVGVQGLGFDLFFSQILCLALFNSQYLF